ncbi:MAG TPA: hydroxymethylbilane synthase [Vicinamibacterales bacterium]|nr:hydroxymethylbilane synthase [Vicinamibacterales bacterium]
MSGGRLRLGTRGSALALWQAREVARRLQEAGGPGADLVTIRTSGDRLQDAPLAEAGGKRLFVKEIEDALLRGEIDLAVHSSKDMPAVAVDGLEIVGVLPREDPLDAVVLPGGGAAGGHVAISTVDDLAKRLGASPVIGTGSVRRIAQLTRLLPGARFVGIRGNVETRLRKLDEGGYDALVLAAAGLRRLGFGGRISFALPATACVPAPGQGIVAVEARRDDEAVRRAVSRIDDPAARAALTAERAVVEALGGGCQVPIGAYAHALDADSFELTAIVVALDGSEAVHARLRGPWTEAPAIGARAAEQLIREGAAAILAEAQRPAAARADRA